MARAGAGREQDHVDADVVTGARVARHQHLGRGGDACEPVLVDRVVELAGMTKHCDFSTQVSVTDPADQNGSGNGRGATTLRPDLVVHLAGGRVVPHQPDWVPDRSIGAHTVPDAAPSPPPKSGPDADQTRLFEALLPHLKPETILASNTSSISITRLASRTDRPERFMGFHFMNPVPVMQLVELIRGIATDEGTYRTLCHVVETLGKIPASAEDFPAFIVNRILLPMINEAIYTLYEGVGNVEAIDAAMKLGAHHPMGPLELADFIGLDTCLSIMQVLHEGLADTKYRPCPLLVKYVEAGWLGRKTNRGFYDYRGETPVPTR